MTDSDDDKKRDEVLKRMLETPPKPHEPVGKQLPSKSGSDKKKSNQK